MERGSDFTRRTALALVGGLIVAGRASAQIGVHASDPTRLLSGAPTDRRLSFGVWRNGQNIGQHTVSFDGDASNFVVEIEAAMVVKLGPIPVFHYHHQATERWRGGRLASFHSQSVSNGKREQVSASRTASGLTIVTSAGQTLVAAPEALPLTHWNQKALNGPLFNPQTGGLLKEAVSHQSDQTVRLADGRVVDATRYSLSGEAQIVDWYDDKGVWTALKAKAMDGSSVDYRRST